MKRLFQPLTNSRGAPVRPCRRLKAALASALAMFTLIPGCACQSIPTREKRSRTIRLELARNVRPIEVVRIDRAGSRRYLLGRYEITNAQYKAFVDATGYDGSDHPSSKLTERFLAQWQDGEFPAGKADYPVGSVNWHHANAFCRWLSRKTGRVVRLPTGGEWEFAARGPEGRSYPWGNRWDPKRCNWGEDGRVDGFNGPAPVGSFPRGATPEGLQDMAGNIWEWCAEKVLRGGPWCERPEWQRAEFVAHEDPQRADDKFGFRILVELGESDPR